MLSLKRNSTHIFKRIVIVSQPSSKAFYHYDKDVYGYRTPRSFDVPEYTTQELNNQIQYSNIYRFVQAYRQLGHKEADLDPLNLAPKTQVPELDPKIYGINPTDETKIPLAGILHIGKSKDISIPRAAASVKMVHHHLKQTYSSRIGFEFDNVSSEAEKRWFAQCVESYEKKPLNSDEKQRIFEILSKSEVFDHFMAKKFPQVKRYGLEGAESMMVALDYLFRYSANGGIRNIILCMPHRGRLNLLTGLLQFSPTALFAKVKGTPEFPKGVPGIGDVLSHLAASVDLDYGASNPVHVSLLHNPSHLEAVNPVAMGKARAKQMNLFELGTEVDCYLGDRVMCVQLHGDAAFTGQGVVTETLGLSNLPHFTSGGSIHLIVNNQIGYTTPAQNARSTVYTSDVGKMINAPVIHVNADYPEEVTHAMNIAFEYRNKFRKDIIVDLIAYRRWGHNELDEPAFTQPIMYKNIRAHESVPKLYEKELVVEKALDQQKVENTREEYFQLLDEHLKASYQYEPRLDSLGGKWENMTISKEPIISPETGVEVDTLRTIGIKSVEAPPNVEVHARLQKYHIENRVKRMEEGTKLDWATGEALAFGSLLKEGYHVRISGQDVGRGTFSQRHVMLVDQNTERTIIPLNRLTKNTDEKQGKLEIANSSLSEFAVMGFETGISWESPNRLCIWEAQFGDFFNGAQIIIDTYISSGEAKWFRQSGIILLLPHGYDGAGPEHSSCRMERFLQLCDDSFDVNVKSNPNMHVVYPTNPAQYFHLLRRQMVRPYRKPLVVIGPKILLRHPKATSDLVDMVPGTTFQPVLSEPEIKAPKRVIFMTGKYYYELTSEREKLKLNDQVAIVRLEELCPFPAEQLQKVIEYYSATAQDFYWVQEEPQNQGAWTFVEPRLNQLLPSKLTFVGREPCAAPASGVSSHHHAENTFILKKAFANL